MLVSKIWTVALAIDEAICIVYTYYNYIIIT